MEQPMKVNGSTVTCRDMESKIGQMDNIMKDNSSMIRGKVRVHRHGLME